MELYLENHSRLESVTTEDLYSNMHLHDGMYDPAQLVSDFPSGRTHNILDEVHVWLFNTFCILFALNLTFNYKNNFKDTTVEYLILHI